MANRFPLIVDSSGLQIKEIPANDNLDLANNSIVNVVDINASGVVTATTFSGSGAGLTSIPSGQLTGALPAIDGSALTGVISGVGIKTAGGNVGFGVTFLDFRGPGISTITAPVSGISTINIIGGGNIAGIDTLGTSYFNNLNVSGVTTASGLLDINAGGQANTFKVEDLTDNRIVIAGTGGELEDDANLTFNGTQLSVTGDLDVDGHTELDNLNVSGITTIGAGTSTIGVEVPTVTLSNNNATVAGTIGTAGQFKQIGGAPFYYDGTAWREFVLSDGTPVTAPADTDWDKVIFRNDFDTSTTDQKLSNAIHDSLNADLVASPVKFGKALRIEDGYVKYPGISEYVFTGAWTIEGWFYVDSMPTGTGATNDASTGFFGHSASGTSWSSFFGLILESSSVGNYEFRWMNNQSATYSHSATNGSGVKLASIGNGSVIDQTWAHIALVREPLDGSIHLYINGTESSDTSSNQVIDNDIPVFQTYYYLTFGKLRIKSNIDAEFDGLIDDVRISTIARYTSNFTAPTSALPTTGTSGTVYAPPGSKQGEISLGGSPTWTGTTGVTASQVASGQYRLTFSSAFGSSTAYTVNANAMDYDPATSIVGVGVSRVSSSVCDFYVRKLSDSSVVDTGSLAVNVYKK